MHPPAPPLQQLPLAHRLKGRFLIIGGIYLDVINVVQAYPDEDSACRALSSERTRGGNAANLSEVLSRLGASVEFVGAVPSRQHPDTQFLLQRLADANVSFPRLEQVGGSSGQPTAFITVSAANGTRTIVSTRNALPELSMGHVSSLFGGGGVLRGPSGGNPRGDLGGVDAPARNSSADATFGDATIGDATIGDATIGDATIGDATIGDATIGDATVEDATVGWCHFECREMPGTCLIADLVRKAAASTQSVLASDESGFASGESASVSPPLRLNPSLLVSVEIEKPSLDPFDLLDLLRSADVVFFSREFLLKHAVAILDAVLDEEAQQGRDKQEKKAYPPPNVDFESEWETVERTLARRLRIQRTHSDPDWLVPRCLVALRRLSNVRNAYWFCAVGSNGAYGLRAASNEPEQVSLHYSPASKPPRVVDTVGAGDTFIASAIYAIANGAHIEQALSAACTLAGGKVAQQGFVGVEKGLPKIAHLLPKAQTGSSA